MYRLLLGRQRNPSVEGRPVGLRHLIQVFPSSGSPGVSVLDNLSQSVSRGCKYSCYSLSKCQAAAAWQTFTCVLTFIEGWDHHRQPALKDKPALVHTFFF